VVKGNSDEVLILKAEDFGGRGSMGMFEQVCERDKAVSQKEPYGRVWAVILKEDSKAHENRHHIHLVTTK